MIIIRATNDNGQVVDLDVLDPSQPLRLDISAIENTSIGNAFGISSQAFSLPGTDKNNQFFGNLFNLGATAAVALQNSVPVQLLTDGQAVFTGKLYITDIITDQKGYTTYQVNLVNETVDFKFQLTETLLAELDWSEYNHAYTYGSITSSWSDNLFSGSIIYPHVNYGIPDGATNIADYAFGTSPTSKTFDNYEYPLRVDQFKPAIKVKTVLDTIFDSVNYKYTSSFIDSAYFNKLYMLMTSYDGLGAYNENPATGSAWAYSSVNQNFNALTATKINFNQEVFDNYGRYDLVNDRYTAYADGYYNFAIGFNYSISNYGVNNRLRFRVQLRKNGTLVGPSKNFVNPVQQGQLYAPFANVQLQIGDYVELFVELFTDDGTEVVTLGSGENNTYFKVEGPASYGGGTVDMSLQFPQNMKALDFIQGLIEKFNLVIEPVSGAKNVLRIEPFFDWANQGVIKDWTDKVDRSVRFKIVHPISEQPKTIIFRDEDDEASNNKYTKDNFGETFGTYIYENESDLSVGERQIGKVFAATPVKGIQNGDTMIIPHLGRLGNNKQTLSPFQFKPRLLVSNGLQDIPGTALGVSSSLLDPGNYWFIDETGTIHKENQYYQMSTFDGLPTSFTTGSDLHFSNLNWYQYFQYTGVNGRTSNDAFANYWAPYINSLYDIDARKLTCNIYIEPTEVQDIQLNDKIFIDGQYYRINKMSGVNITEKATVEVELIKELNRKLNYPRRRVISGSGTIDLQIQSVNEDGTVVYQDFNGGTTVQDYGLIKQVAFKDQYTVFDAGGTGSVTWNIPTLVTLQQEKAVFGSNQIDDSVATLLVAGGNNTVEGQTNNLSIIGDDNTVRAGSTNIAISGVKNEIDFSVDNAAIIAGTGAAISGSSANTVIVGGTGSLSVNNDWVVSINGENDAIRDSDNTTAINSHQNEVIVNGSGHVVIGLNLEGGGLDLLNTRNNSNWLGDTYLGESIFRPFVQLECGSGTSISLTGSLQGQGRHENLYVMNWSGLSPGTTTIELPSATNNDYKNVVYQFVSNGSFQGANGSLTEVEIVGFSGQTINGQSSYILKNPYQSVVLTTSGSGWITLQDNVTNTYGAFYATGSQALAVANTSQSIILNDGWEDYGMYIASGSRIYIENPGTYKLSAVIQLANDSNQPEDAVFWLKFNGTNWPFSSTRTTIPAEKSAGVPSSQVIAMNFVGTSIAPNDYVELYWAGTDTDLSLKTYPVDSLGAGEPAAPPVSVMITPVS